MRNSSKKLSMHQCTHFNGKLGEITKLVRESAYRKAFTIVNKEFERSLQLETGWRIRIQLLRRGIMCLLGILKSYAKSKHENQSQVLHKLMQYIEFYYQILEQQADQMVIFYLKELLLRIQQIKYICSTLTHIDVRASFKWQLQYYYPDFRFLKELYLYATHKGNIHFTFKLFDQSITYYHEALSYCQQILEFINKQDYHLKKLESNYMRTIKWIAITLYTMAYVYEMNSNYTKLLETLKLSKWFADITDNITLKTKIYEYWVLAYSQYYNYILDIHEMNTIISRIFPIQNTQNDINIDYWTALNSKFHLKYSTPILIYTPYEDVQQSISINQYQKKHLTEQETTMQTALQTPRQQEKQRTFISTFHVRTITSLEEQNKLLKPLKQHKLTLDYDLFKQRLPKQESEQFLTQKETKELDAYYENKVLKSFSHSKMFSSLQSMKNSVQGQQEINKIYQTDLNVGKKLLKFQKYTQQHIRTQSNLQKIKTNLTKEHEYLQCINSARNFLKGNSDIELKHQMSAIIKNRSTHQEGEVLNLKTEIDKYESKFSTYEGDQYFEPSSVGKHIRRSHINLFQSLNFKKIEQTIKTRKSFLSRVQETLFRK